MQINLRQARRLERDILNAQNKLSQDLTDHQIRVTIHEDFDATVDATQAKIEAAVVGSVNLSALRFAVRKGIETQNEAAGINALMNEEAKLKDLQKITEMALAHVVSDNDLKIAKARHEAMIKSGPTTTSYSTVDYIDVNGHVTSKHQADLTNNAKDISKRLVKIVEELSTLNTTTLIDLDADSVELLEKHGIVI